MDDAEAEGRRWQSDQVLIESVGQGALTGRASTGSTVASLAAEMSGAYAPPLYGVLVAARRADGQPPAGWYPEERLTLPEAIRGFTYDAAYAAFEEESRGTIEPGKLADFTILEQNPYDVAPSQLFELKVKYTVVGGEIVYPK